MLERLMTEIFPVAPVNEATIDATT